MFSDAIIPAFPDVPLTVALPHVVGARITKIGLRGGLDGAIAAGLLLRFGSPKIEVLLVGCDPVEKHFTAWITDLGGSAVQLRNLASTSLDGMHVHMDDLEASFNPEDPFWIHTLQDLVASRDDLASVAWVLRRTNYPLEDEVLVFDQRLSPFLGGVPLELPLTDPYLIALHHREATWWTAGPWVVGP